MGWSRSPPCWDPGVTRPPAYLLDGAALKPISQPDGPIHLGTPNDDYRPGRTRGDSPGIEGQQQEAGAAGTGGAGSWPDRPERARRVRGAAAAGEARDHRRGLWRRHPARQAAQAREAVRAVRPPRAPDRFRGDGRPAGRPGVFAAGAGRRGRRSSESSGANRTIAQGRRRRQEIARLARCAGDLLGAGAAARERGLKIGAKSVLIESEPKLRIFDAFSSREPVSTSLENAMA